MKRPARFTQVEMVRALRAIAQAGVTATIELTPEGLRVVFGKGKPKTEQEPAEEKVLML